MRFHPFTKPSWKKSEEDLYRNFQLMIMTNEEIAKRVEAVNEDVPLNIYFKQRGSITGIFIRTEDYRSLKSKNLWRIVTEKHFEPWRKTRDANLARIFNGIEFTKITESVL